MRDVNTHQGHPMTTLNVNGKTVTVDADPSTPLLWVIREQLGMTGTKYGCGVAQCGSCTVLMNGEAVRTCVYPLSAVGNQKIETIESLERNGQLTKIQNAWVQHEVPQCGYCQSGMVMATTALLRKKPQPTDADIDAAITNICRCGTFQEVRAAIHTAAKS
jgi:isoquinoline 1-oxidoreductase alpha subunit